MKVEIAHDILAKSVYQRASQGERLRLRIQGFIKQRYEYYKWKGALLTVEDLRYIEPFIEDLEISQGQKAFINESEQYLLNKQRRRQIMRILYVTLPIFATGMLFMGFQATEAKEYQVKTTVLRDSVEVLKTEVEFKEKVAEKAQEQVEVLEKKAQEQASFLEENKEKLSEEQKKELPKPTVKLNTRLVDLVKQTVAPKDTVARQLKREKREEERAERQEQTKVEQEAVNKGAERFEQNLQEGAQGLKDFFKNRKKKKQEQEQREKEEDGG